MGSEMCIRDRPWWPVGGGLSGRETKADTRPLPEPADPQPICPL